MESALPFDPVVLQLPAEVTALFLLLTRGGILEVLYDMGQMRLFPGINWCGWHEYRMGQRGLLQV